MRLPSRAKARSAALRAYLAHPERSRWRLTGMCVVRAWRPLTLTLRRAQAPDLGAFELPVTCRARSYAQRAYLGHLAALAAFGRRWVPILEGTRRNLLQANSGHQRASR